MRALAATAANLAAAVVVATLAVAVLPSEPAVHSLPGAMTGPAVRSVDVRTAPAAVRAPAAATATDTVPAQTNDPFFADQWGLAAVAAPGAWQQRQATGRGVTVAVIDSGVDLNHADFTCPGKLTIVPRSDAVAGDGVPDDEFGHGTHVAGIIAACANNGAGIAGVAPHASILPLRVLDANGSTNNFTSISEAIDLATTSGAHVINLSLNALINGLVPAFVPGLLTELDGALARAVEAGVVVVAAAGNEGYSLCGYPALAARVVCVGAVDKRDVKAVYSNLAYKSGADEENPTLVAPGGSLVLVCDLPEENVLSLWPAQLDSCDEGRLGYTAISGTSMAAPHVAGVAALVYGRMGGIRTAANGATVRRALLQNADDLGVPGLDPVYGFGRVNAERAIQDVEVVALLPSAPSAGPPSRRSLSAGPPHGRRWPARAVASPKAGAPVPGRRTPAASATSVPLVDPKAAPAGKTGGVGALGLLSLAFAIGGTGVIVLSRIL